MNEKSKRVKQAERMEKNKDRLQCPICASSVQIENRRRMTCVQNHSFDIAKQGYVFLLTKPTQTHYTKKLFEQRRKINLHTPFYKSFQRTLAALIDSYLPKTTNPLQVIDMGTGEGSHLQMITSYLSDHLNRPVLGIGLDIAKEGIVQAAKHDAKHIWLVADIAHSPVSSGSMDIVLNILSPSNYKEFDRIRSKNGVIIKAIPGNSYMREMRQFFHSTSNASQANELVRNHFSDHFQIKEIINVRETCSLTSTERRALAIMSPLTWDATSEKVNAFVADGPGEITIDLDVIIGK